MAIVERLMQTDPDPTRHIAVHTFFAAVAEVNSGHLTLQQVKNYLNTTAADDVELDAMAALVTGDQANRLEMIGRFHAVFILAAIRAPGYDTEAAVRSKLGI